MEPTKVDPISTVHEAPTPGFQIPAYVLDDLCSRFIINIPEEERQDLIRVFFQIELAHWFYLDFYCAENQELRTCGIKDFSAQVFKHCPFLSCHAGEVDKILENWKSYKMSVPTFGAIMLDPDMSYCLLAQGFWTKCSWGFPKGKVNENESAHDCAIREVLEETGFDITSMLDKNEYLENHFNDQLTRLYIVPGVGLDTKFQPKTRKEIKERTQLQCTQEETTVLPQYLQWFPIEALPAHKRDQTPKAIDMNPNNFFMVIPFVKPLRKWIEKKMEQPYIVDTDFEIKGGNLSTQKQIKVREQLESNLRQYSDGRQQAREKQRQKLQQYFAQQNQNEFQEYMQLKEKGSKARSDSPRKEYNKSRGPENKSPKPGRKQQYHILNRDGSVTGSTPSPSSSPRGPGNILLGQTRRNISSQFGNPGGYPRVQNANNNNIPSSAVSMNEQRPHILQRQRKYQKITDPDGLGSETWLNFHLDVNAIMACLP